MRIFNRRVCGPEFFENEKNWTINNDLEPNDNRIDVEAMIEF